MSLPLEINPTSLTWNREKTAMLWPSSHSGLLEVLLLPVWILLLVAFSLYIMKKFVLNPSFKGKTQWRRWLHVGGFVFAFGSAAIVVLLYSMNIAAPPLAALSGIAFALNGAMGLAMLTIVPSRWVTWKRLFAIGGLFNVGSGLFTCLLFYPSYGLYLAVKCSLPVLFAVGFCEVFLAIMYYIYPGFLQGLFPAQEPKNKSVTTHLVEFFLKRGQLPNKNLYAQIVAVEGVLILTLYVILSWVSFLDYTKFESFSMETRMSAAGFLLTSLWGNSLSTLGPTLLYRGQMPALPALLMYNLFAFPFPQFTGALILYHPLNFHKRTDLVPIFGPWFWGENPEVAQACFSNSTLPTTMPYSSFVSMF